MKAILHVKLHPTSNAIPIFFELPTKGVVKIWDGIHLEIVSPIGPLIGTPPRSSIIGSGDPVAIRLACDPCKEPT